MMHDNESRRTFVDVWEFNDMSMVSFTSDMLSPGSAVHLPGWAKY